MTYLAFPDECEIIDILKSRAARTSDAENRAMLFSTVVGGMKFKIALVQESGQVGVHSARFVAAASDVDLRDCFGPITKRSKK